ncbi:hypothetical protein [Teredinibacter sp. KSP-S5-2]|uniref:hypothetical protein n=1 Tax=Teredinibacter sp. KSP-S5-2 TaxID=3034506 RepID=UPI002934D4F8|nr:hypothetical protein [Teredinibacter sp. KSP-S5-2]WNO10584.1 hypothetical protein P5V12_05295 [Teredinibacter sp. KSP-S5-2]
MKKDLYIYLQDGDQGVYSIIGPVAHEFANDWLTKGNDARSAGHNIKVVDFWGDELQEYHEQAKSQGLSEVDSLDILDSPRDSSVDYKGNLPKYAQDSARNKLIKLLCKGKCRKTVLAELNVPYPGREQLKKAPMGQYKARCLKCNSVAQDNYNWYRD